LVPQNWHSNIEKIPNAGVWVGTAGNLSSTIIIKVHPLALLKHKEIKDPGLSTAIAELIKGYECEEGIFLS